LEQLNHTADWSDVFREATWEALDLSGSKLAGLRDTFGKKSLGLARPKAATKRNLFVPEMVRTGFGNNMDHYPLVPCVQCGGAAGRRGVGAVRQPGQCMPG
jgi:predicted molibdopterin-dependent oxidoreductase YjgC